MQVLKDFLKHCTNTTYMHEPEFILMFISLQNCFETIIKTSNKTKLNNDKYERPEKPQ